MSNNNSKTSYRGIRSPRYRMNKALEVGMWLCVNTDIELNL